MRRKSFAKENKKGFTLVELVISLSIVVMLFALVFPLMTANTQASSAIDTRTLCYYIHNSSAAIFKANPEEFVGASSSMSILYDPQYISVTEESTERHTVTVKYDRKLQPVATDIDSEYDLVITVVRSTIREGLYRFDYHATITRKGNSFYDYPAIVAYKESV